MQNVYCRYAPSLGALEGTPEEAWGTPPYIYSKHKYEPTVFFGMYDLRDYIALWRHRGKAWVLWAGSDIRHIRANFIFNDGKLLWLSRLFDSFGFSFRSFLIKRVLKKAKHWVENEGEAWQLKDIGIKVAGICPSFMGEKKDYYVSFKPGNKVYLSSSYGRESEYGYGIVAMIACALPKIQFHLYGSDIWEYQPLSNVYLHGRMPKEQMNRQIKRMQCGLRLNKHDGFSEITAKSILWGQYPITYLYHPHIDQYVKDNCGQPYCLKGLNNLVRLLGRIPKKKRPNLKARAWYLKNLNNYPWVNVQKR